MLAIAGELGVRREWLQFDEGAMLSEAGQRITNVEPGPDIASPYRAVKIVGTAQMGAEGYWHALDDGDGVVDIPSRDPGAYALRLKGDSMAPAIRSGWIAVCEPNGRLVPGEYVMIRLRDGESMLKLLGYANDVEVGVLSVNPIYDMRTIAFDDIEQIHFVGAIVPPSKVRI
ncbi:Cro/Cl family transcriptional regulator [Pseudomonas stutzeri]|nr:Cro/Cl family transcriptional regulator [Stutzerimonas stutzeri]